MSKFIKIYNWNVENQVKEKYICAKLFFLLMKSMWCVFTSINISLISLTYNMCNVYQKMNIFISNLSLVIYINVANNYVYLPLNQSMLSI